MSYVHHMCIRFLTSSVAKVLKIGLNWPTLIPAKTLATLTSVFISPCLAHGKKSAS